MFYELTLNLVHIFDEFLYLKIQKPFCDLKFIWAPSIDEPQYDEPLFFTRVPTKNFDLLLSIIKILVEIFIA